MSQPLIEVGGQLLEPVAAIGVAVAALFVGWLLGALMARVGR